MRTFFCVCLLAAYSMLNAGLACDLAAAPSAANEKSDRGEGRGGGGGGGG